MFKLASGLFMGWSLGSNDSANVFGTAVASKTVKFRTAVILCSCFIIAGSFLGGARGMHTLSGLVDQTLNTAFVASLAAAVTVTIMTILKLPVSTSQAMVGAIIGIGICVQSINISGLTKVAVVWIGTPLGTVVLAVILFPLAKKIFNSLPVNIFTKDYILKSGLILSGCYASYSLGANNVANVTGVYTEVGLLNMEQALLLGGVSIALGVITYSKNVMMTVGKKLVKLDPFSAFIAVLSQAVILDVYARIGVPTSSSQAIIGAVLGIGIIKGFQTINLKTLGMIITGWIVTPCIAALVSVAVYLAVI
jgi:inorganic phosphate transporter, PiT family